MGWIHNANAAVARSVVGRYFRLEGSGHVSAITMSDSAHTNLMDSQKSARVPTSLQKFVQA